MRKGERIKEKELHCIHWLNKFRFDIKIDWIDSTFSGFNYVMLPCEMRNEKIHALKNIHGSSSVEIAHHIRILIN